MVVHEGLRDGTVEASTRALGIRFSGWVDTRRIPRRCRRWAGPPSKSLLLPENRIRGVREERRAPPRARPCYGGRMGTGGSGRRRHGGPGRSGTTGCHALHTGDWEDLQPIPTEVEGWSVHRRTDVNPKPRAGLGPACLRGTVGPCAELPDRNGSRASSSPGGRPSIEKVQRSEAGSKPVPVPEEQGVNRRGISGESHPEDARRTSCRETPEYRIHPMPQSLRTASFTGGVSRFPILLTKAAVRDGRERFSPPVLRIGSR